MFSTVPNFPRFIFSIWLQLTRWLVLIFDSLRAFKVKKFLRIVFCYTKSSSSKSYELYFIKWRPCSSNIRLVTQNSRGIRYTRISRTLRKFFFVLRRRFELWRVYFIVEKPTFNLTMLSKLCHSSGMN